MITIVDKVKDIASKQYAGSNYFKSRIISLDTGKYYDIETIKWSIKNTCQKAMSDQKGVRPLVDINEVTEGIHSIDPITKEQYEQLLLVNKEMIFFENVFENVKNVKVLVKDVYEEYCNLFPKLNKTAFMHRLKAWVKDAGYNYEFFNRLAKRRIKVW